MDGVGLERNCGAGRAEGHAPAADRAAGQLS